MVATALILSALPHVQGHTQRERRVKRALERFPVPDPLLEVRLCLHRCRDLPRDDTDWAAVFEAWLTEQFRVQLAASSITEEVLIA